VLRVAFVVEEDRDRAAREHVDEDDPHVLSGGDAVGESDEQRGL